MIKENIAQFYTVEIIVGRWKLWWAVGTAKPTNLLGYWPKKLSAHPVEVQVRRRKKYIH